MINDSIKPIIIDKAIEEKKHIIIPQSEYFKILNSFKLELGILSPNKLYILL